MTEIPEIDEVKTVWLTETNTDLTEGRGFSRILFVCEQYETASRLGRKGYVQGSDCPVRKSFALRIKNTWFVPGRIEPESDKDLKIRLQNEEKNAIMTKMLEAGFTPEDIEKLQG